MIIHPKNILLVLAAGLVVILGAIGYVFYSQSVMPGKVDSITTSIRQQSKSDETASIESDLNATEINSIDSDLNNIEKQISE